MTLSRIFKSISKKEWLFVFVISVIVIIITLLPLLYGWLITPENQVFTAVHFVAPNDWIVYYSYIEQVKQGNWLFENLFSPEPQLPTLNILWLAVGLFAKAFNFSAPLALNLSRVILIPIFYFVAYLFIAYLFDQVKKRQLALILLSFSSGLGLLLIGNLLKYPFNYYAGEFRWPLDLWVPESNTFLTLYYSPHFILSLTLFLAVLFLTLLYLENKKIAYSLGAGIAAAFLFAFHPFHVISIFGIIAVYFIFLFFKKRNFFDLSMSLSSSRQVVGYSWKVLDLFSHYLILLCLSLPSIFYYLILLKIDPVLELKSLQNICTTPSLFITMVSYGLLLAFSLAGIYILVFKKRVLSSSFSFKESFIVFWAIAQFLIIYFPVNYQRRMSEGLHFPLVILTAIGLAGLIDFIRRRESKIALFFHRSLPFFLACLAFLLISSNVFQIAADATIYQSRLDISYLDQEVVAAIKWLKNLEPEAIIFNTAKNRINVIPAYAGRRVYAGHGVETPYFGLKQQEVNWFFSKNRSDEIEKNFLLKRKVDYIFYGPWEREIGSWSFADKEYLREVFVNSKVRVFEVLCY